MRTRLRMIDRGDGHFGLDLDVAVDGDQVSVLWGDSLAEGLCGFGDTLPDAIHDFATSLRESYANGREVDIAVPRKGGSDGP